MLYIQANIGRNIDGEPMSDNKFDRFVSAVNDAIYYACDTVAQTEVHYGTGTWGEETEQSAHISLLVFAVHTDKLDRALASLARQYGQESIALIIAQSKLISPN